MTDLYIFTGGSGTIGKKYINYISEFNENILNIDLIENKNAKFNLVHNLTEINILNLVKDFLESFGELDSINFIHLASIVGESQKNDWVTDIEELGIKRSEDCYTISVTMPAKLISIFTNFAYTKGVYINSIYGTHPPDFSLYKNNPKLQNPISYGSIKAAQIYSMHWLNNYFKTKLRLNSISPGGIESQNMDKEFKKLYLNKTLGSNFTSITDIIETSEFILSNNGKGIYGQNIFVDYGFR